MKTIYLAAAMAAAWMSSGALAQVIYQPVRYQYGPQQNVYYGGTSRIKAAGGTYVPPGLQISPPATAEPVVGANVYGPGSIPFTTVPNASPMGEVHVFSDVAPYEEVGQYGYTPDDARNEAYANVPLYQGGGRLNGPAAVVTVPPAEPAQPQASYTPDPKAKAIPLLDWAKAEHRKNPELYRALVDLARKFDPQATEMLEQNMANER